MDTSDTTAAGSSWDNGTATWMTICTKCPPSEIGGLGDEYTCPECGSEWEVEKTWVDQNPIRFTVDRFDD